MVPAVGLDPLNYTLNKVGGHARGHLPSCPSVPLDLGNYRIQVGLARDLYELFPLVDTVGHAQ